MPEWQEEKDGLVFGAAELRSKWRVEPVEGRKLHAGDVDFGVFGRSADIEKVELFAMLEAVVDLAWCDGGHNSSLKVICGERSSS